MKKHLVLLLVTLCIGVLGVKANPVDLEKAKMAGQRFLGQKLNKELKNSDLQLVYSGMASRNEACFYVFNAGETGFVIVSADDRFRPIVGYSDEGPFATENMSPELRFYLDKIIEARTSRNAVIFQDVAEEWRSVFDNGKMLSRNGGRGVDYICTTLWNQDAPYNLYAPEANGGPGNRCYAGCVATAMSQVMKHWDHPSKGSGSHSYYCYGYGQQSANFGNTIYDWDNMPDRLYSSSPQEQIEAVALLMYHCAVAVDMNFSPSGSGANSWDVPGAIRQYFSYSNQATLKSRDQYSLTAWQNLLKESFDLGWPVYYSGHSEGGGHAFVCDGYDDNNLFHFNWGWGGSSDGWFVVDEIDYNGWAQAVFNFVPTDVYTYMPKQPTDFTVVPSNDFSYSATLQWTNPTQNIHNNAISSIDEIVVTRNGEIIYTENNVSPGETMSYTDHYMPAVVNYAVYAVVRTAKGLKATSASVVLGPTCEWTVEMTAPEGQGWNGGYLYFVNEAGQEIARVNTESGNATRTLQLPLGHVNICWAVPYPAVEEMGFNIKNSVGQSKVAFEGSSSDMEKGLFYIANNTCSDAGFNVEGPHNLTCVVSSNETALAWEPCEGLEVVNYHVYRDDLLYAVCYDTQYTIPEGAGSFHTYYVTAFTEEGESNPSNLCSTLVESECDIPTNLRYVMTTPTKAKLSWDAPQASGLTGYYVYRRTAGEEIERIKLVSNTTYTDNLNLVVDGRYQYFVKAYYAATDCVSGFATAQDHPERCFVEVNKTIIPWHLGFQAHGDYVELSWDAGTKAESYNVYRDGQRIAEGITETTFIDDDVVPQQAYRYTVTGNTAFLESNPSNEVYVDLSAVVVESNDEIVSMLYPNPTQGKVFVEAKNLRQVRVFDLLGQLVAVQAVDVDKTTLDLSSQPKGCYFIEMSTNQGCATKKLVKIQ